MYTNNESVIDLMNQNYRLREALQNMVGAFDNAVRRLKMPSEFCDEAIASARAVLTEEIA